MSMFVFLPRYNEKWKQGKGAWRGKREEERRGGGLRSLTAQNNKLNLRFQVHDLSDSRKTNEITALFTIAYRFGKLLIRIISNSTAG